MLVYNNNDSSVELYKCSNKIQFKSIHQQDLKPATSSNKKLKRGKKQQKNKLNRKNKQFLQSLGYKLKS